MEKNKLIEAFKIIETALYEWENRLCPDWKTCSMSKLDRAEKRAVEARRKFAELRDILLK